MATRMQQRRGTAAQWTAANPILAAGEIGFETDTSKFKMGNGSSTWSALQYFANAAELAAIIDSAPGTMDTLNELAAALGDDPAFFTTTANSLALKAPIASPTFTGTVSGITKSMVGLGSVDNTTDASKPISTATQTALDLKSPLASPTFTGTVSGITKTMVGLSDVDNTADTAKPVSTAQSTAIALAKSEAIADATSQVSALLTNAPAALDTLDELAAALADDANFSVTMTSALAAKASLTNLSDHEADTSNVHGIVNTLVLTTQDQVDTLIGNHNTDTTAVHGITDTALLATKAYSDNAVATHDTDTTSVHGIADTSALATKVYADGAVTTHSDDTTGVHGITDSANLVYTSDSRLTDTRTPSDLSVQSGKLADSAVITAKIADSAVTSAKIADLTIVDGDISASAAIAQSKIDGLSTSLSAKADLAGPTFTGTVSGITSTMVGLGNVDNTADSAKPVSTATQTALDAKASLAGATFTGNVEVDGNIVVDGDLTVNGTNFSASATSITIEDNMVQLAHQNAANTVDLGIVVGYNDGAAKHSGIVRDVSADKWKLFKGVTTEPSTTVDFTQGSLDALQVGALEATTVTPSSGVVFSDGTQTKEGVPSQTPIIQKSAAYTLSALTERDSLIEVSAAAVITIPTDATLNYPIGTSIDVLQTGAGAVSIAPVSGTVTVNATPGLTLRTQWSSATLFKRAANTWVVYGDLK